MNSSVSAALGPCCTLEGGPVASCGPGFARKLNGLSGYFRYRQGTLRVVLLEQATPRGSRQPAFEHTSVAGRPAVVVVVDLGTQNEQVNQWRTHQHVLHGLERSEPHDVADAAGAVVADVEAPRFVAQVCVTHELDVAWITNTQPGLVRQTNVADAEWIEAHQLRRVGID